MTCLLRGWWFWAPLFALIFLQSFAVLEVGTTSDEWAETENARSHWHLITDFYAHGDFKNPYDKILNNYEYYGVWVNMFAFPLQYEISGGRIDSFASYRAKHYVGLALTWIAIAATAWALWRVTRNRYAPAAIVAAFLLTPYWFGHSLFNPKDAPLAAMMTLATIVLSGFIAKVVEAEKSKIPLSTFRLLTAGWVVGLTASVRIVGGITGLYLAVLLPLALWLHRAPLSWRLIFRTVFRLYLVGAIAFACIWLLHPAAWSDPFKWIWDTIKMMAHFPYNVLNITNGKHLYAMSLPWNYIPQWVFAKTPLLMLVLNAVGLMIAVIRFRTADVRTQVLHMLFLLQLLVVPTIIVAEKGALYDGVRQILFIFPSIVWFAAYGALSLPCYLFHPRLRRSITILMALVCAATLRDVARLHPYYYTYFNEIIRLKPIDGRWDTDYWVLAYKEMAEYVNRFRPASGTVWITSYNNMYLYLNPGIKVEQRDSLTQIPKTPGTLILQHTRTIPNAGSTHACPVIATISRPLGNQRLTYALIRYCS